MIFIHYFFLTEIVFKSEKQTRFYLKKSSQKLTHPFFPYFP